MDAKTIRMSLHAPLYDVRCGYEGMESALERTADRALTNMVRNMLAEIVLAMHADGDKVMPMVETRVGVMRKEGSYWSGRFESCRPEWMVNND